MNNFRNVAVVNTGTELMNGTTVNTNFSRLCAALTAEGFSVELGLTAGDRPEAIYRALGAALKSADCVIVSGGLGSTRDDMTLASVGRFFGWELEESPELRERIERFWFARHPQKRIPTMVLRQALLPRGAEALFNVNGSAPGIRMLCRYDGRERLILLLPGPPREFLPMVETELLPRLRALRAGAWFTRGFLAAGRGELELQKLLEPPVSALGAELGYCARPEGTRVFVSAPDEAAAEAALAAARKLVGSDALEPGELELLPSLFRLLRQRGFTFGCAESCTGGMMAAAVTHYPGVSAFFKGGAVVYSNELKQKLLGVPEAVLQQHGAVSAECAEAMVGGALKALGCDAAAAVTGIAGPDGGTPEKPVGLVYIGAAAGERRIVREFRFPGDRDAVRERTCANAFLMVRELLLAEC